MCGADSVAHCSGLQAVSTRHCLTAALYSCMFRFCLDGTVWTEPLVVLVICCGAGLVFMTIIFIFVYIETRRASGKVGNPHLH